MKLTSKNTKTKLLWATESLNRRIRELESELQVRDDMGKGIERKKNRDEWEYHGLRWNESAS